MSNILERERERDVQHKQYYITVISSPFFNHFQDHVCGFFFFWQDNNNYSKVDKQSAQEFAGSQKQVYKL